MQQLSLLSEPPSVPVDIGLALTVLHGFRKYGVTPLKSVEIQQNQAHYSEFGHNASLHYHSASTAASGHHSFPPFLRAII